MLGESHLSRDRTAFSTEARLTGGQRLIKGGWGIFFDQVRLTKSTPSTGFNSRIEQDFNGTEAAPAGPPVRLLENRVDPDLEEPLSRVMTLA